MMKSLLGKPVFGICRGLQIINVAFGGNLYQDLAKQNPDSYMKHSQSAPGHFPTHFATIAKDSEFYGIFGEKAYVNSRHHQEAIESDDQLITAVQWHPENMWREDAKQLEIFKQFVAKCR